MSRLAGDWSHGLEVDTARLVLRTHATGRCLSCHRDGCEVWAWARRIRRRETAVAQLRAGVLPDGVTVEELAAAAGVELRGAGGNR